VSVTVWAEFRQELTDPAVARIYPDGIHERIADGLRGHGLHHVRTAWLDQPDCGLSADVLEDTDVLVWWGTWRTTRSRTSLPTESVTVSWAEWDS
jgi:trehalose utilization protein